MSSQGKTPKLTRAQQSLVTRLSSGQSVNYLVGGGWRLMDGRKVHHRTIQSLASKGVIKPASKDLFDQNITSYRIS
ncbi:hypothetical protein [Vreelandella aquamarina]|uniref:hypothetical protein n=1 Tax=Vreelandella aquamarina TaxID=77097 RepID=UPI0013319575|nr:hypothetical protein [Halomonas meridiana]